MAQSLSLSGAEVRLYISGKAYPEAQSISWTIDYGEEETYGVDSHFAQEIAPTIIKVSGKITGVRVKVSGGLQGAAARAKISDILKASYTSLRVQDISTDKELLWLPQMRVTTENIDISAKGIARLSFNFKGIIPYNEMDRY